jgi:tRNA modification GTPase
MKMAKPGEFTLRAIRNGKMSFSQAEGLNALLTANSEFVMSQGLEMLSGDLNITYQRLYQNFLKIKAALDMQIDFSEDVGQDECTKQLLDSLNASMKDLNELFARVNFKSSSIIESKVILLGPPNSGKSSLFNSLLGKNRSIISDIAGTTRDYIEGLLNIEGQQFTLVDTAGMRATQDPLEKQGVERTKTLLPNAFLTIYVHNPALDFVQNIEEVDIVAITHMDQTSDATIRNLKIPFKYKSLIYIKIGPIGPNIVGGSIGPDSLSGSIGPIFSKESLDSVKSLIIQKFKDITSRNPIVIERQVQAIKLMHQSAHELNEALADHSKNSDIAIMSFYVDKYGRSIQSLMGIVDSEHILNYIFANFCIGK